MTLAEEDLIGALDAVPTCRSCGSERVVREAWASWNPELGKWELDAVLDRELCHHCEEETSFVWTRRIGEARTRIRELNDAFRTKGAGNGSVMITEGVRALGSVAVQRILDTVRRFDAFTEDNDPWGEHEFGAFEAEGEKVFFKIDYYSARDLAFGTASENPANAHETHRVLTILLASEY